MRPMRPIWRLAGADEPNGIDGVDEPDGADEADGAPIGPMEPMSNGQQKPCE